MKNARIITSFGDFTISYTTQEELENELANLKNDIELITRESAEILPPKQRLPKPGLEHVYRFTPDGKLELLHYPKKNVKIVLIALYAYHPDSVSVKTIESVTGINNVASRVLNQTLNKQYFRKVNEAYGLSSDGLTYLNNDILPSLFQTTTEENSE
jgi:hypothetical protein